jgi:hypothetical protein
MKSQGWSQENPKERISHKQNREPERRWQQGGKPYVNVRKE